MEFIRGLWYNFKVKILGIETSCDETAAAVVEDGMKILSNVVVSQIDIFAEYGGVIPEVAARSHLEAILPVINKALAGDTCAGVAGFVTDRDINGADSCDFA